MRVDQTCAAVVEYLREHPSVSLNVNELVHRLPAHRETMMAALDQLRAEGTVQLDMGHYGLPRERFPAPREDDCAYGCCKAGDVGLWSDVRPQLAEDMAE